MSTRILYSYLAFFIALLIQYQPIAAQSGRVVPKSPLPAEPPKSADTLPAFRPDPNVDKYRIIFPTRYDGKLNYNPQKAKKTNSQPYAQAVNFIEELNKVGAQGYRLQFTAQNYPPIGIAKLGEVQYEYAWFQTISDLFFTKAGFANRYAPLAQQGFSLIDILSLGTLCDSPSVSYDQYGAVPQVQSDDCIFEDLFLLERVKGEDKPKEFSLARQYPRWQQPKGDASFESQILDFWRLGFYPTHAFSKYEILLQKTVLGETMPEKPEVQIVSGKSVQSSVNALAREGYRLRLIREDIAVMVREKGTVTPTSYRWWNGAINSEEEWSQLQAQGAIYRMTSPDSEKGAERALVFEQPLVPQTKRYEYKRLIFELKTVENKAQKKSSLDLTAASQETVKTLNRLVKEGFDVREVFAWGVAGSVSVLLERVR